MSKCVLCGRELLTGDVHWEQGLCNECYRKTKYPDPYFDIVVDRRKLDIREKYIEKLEEENRILKEQNEAIIKQEELIGEKLRKCGVDNIEDFVEIFQQLKGKIERSDNGR